MLDRISYDYMMESRNIDGDIYHCDIERWLGVSLDSKQRKDLHHTINSIKNSFCKVEGQSLG